MDRPNRRPLTVWVRPAVSVAVVALVASPALRQRDSYPLSTYPVYAEARPATAELPTAVGVTAAGDRIRLSPTAIGASDDPLIVADRVADSIAGGRAERLCLAIVERAVVERPRLVGVEVVTETVDLVATAIDGATPPAARTVHARCPVAP